MKIALCLAGRTGGIEIDGKSSNQKLNPILSYNLYKKNILSIPDNDVDIYMHSWNKEDENRLVDLYSPIKYLFEDPISNNNIESRVISIKKCLKFVEESNIHYDFIMISRFDIVILTPIIFKKFTKNRFIASHWNDRGNRYNHLNGFYDLWFIANQDIFKKLLFWDIPKKLYLLNPHIFWKKLFNQRIDKKLLQYSFYVGEHYELTRRYFYPNSIYDNNQIEKNLLKFIKDFQNKP